MQKLKVKLHREFNERTVKNDSSFYYIHSKLVIIYIG